MVERVKLNPYKFHISFCRLDTRKYLFSKRIETVRNSLKARHSHHYLLSSYCCDEAKSLNSQVFNNLKFVLSS